MALRTVTATRYVTPLREGGSLPAIVEADDDGTYVLKFRGAGQGHRALVAELITGELARALGLPVPEIVLMELDPVFGRTEPDQEIQDLLRASAGLNLALDYLPGSVTFDPLVPDTVQEDPHLASRIVWFDAFTTNVDRTARNTNMLVWHDRLWLIDHGASLYFHHGWDDHLKRSRNGFPAIHDHVLLPFADELDVVDAEMTSAITAAMLQEVVRRVPAEWLGDVDQLDDVEAHRNAYIEHLMLRLEEPRQFLEDASHARRQV
jgi:hypothetical protein